MRRVSVNDYSGARTCFKRRSVDAFSEAVDRRPEVAGLPKFLGLRTCGCFSGGVGSSAAGLGITGSHHNNVNGNLGWKCGVDGDGWQCGHVDSDGDGRRYSDHAGAGK